MKKLLKYLRHYKAQAVLAPLFINHASKILVRVFIRGNETDDEEYYLNAIKTAVDAFNENPPLLQKQSKTSPRQYFLTVKKRLFDTVILDPPAFCKTADEVKDAYRGYKDINLTAMKIVKSGGFLITCSCSHYMR